MQPDPSGTVSCPSCPACAAAERKPYYRHGEWELFSCTGCGLIYLDPMPGPQMLRTLYHDAYDNAQRSYFSKREAKLRRCRGRMRHITRRLGGKTGNFLDIGCNGGFMAEAARIYGFHAWGVEPDGVSVEYARRHFPRNQYFHGRLEDFTPEDSAGAPIAFDIAYCSEVIEHVPQPVAFLRHIFHLLAPGGLLYLTTPDISHWRRPRLLERWDAFCPPAHCLYFSPQSLLNLVTNCGFEVYQRRIAWKPGVKLIVRRPALS